jgi:hypothetical protein
MIHKTEKPKKRPYWASPDVWERTFSIVNVMLLGHRYEIPVTEKTRPILCLLDGDLDPWKGFRGRRSDFNRRDLAERGLMDIISAIYHQVEAVAIAGEAQMLGQEIRDKLEPLIQRTLHKRVATAMKPPLELEPPKPPPPERNDA